MDISSITETTSNKEQINDKRAESGINHFNTISEFLSTDEYGIFKLKAIKKIDSVLTGIEEKIQKYIALNAKTKAGSETLTEHLKKLKSSNEAERLKLLKEIE